MRARVAALLAVLALLLGACGTVSSSSAAVVGDTQVSMTEFSRLVAARVEGLGLQGDALAQAQQAVDLGLLDTDVVRQGVGQAIQDGRMSQSDLPQVPAAVVDDLFTTQREASGARYQPSLDELGLSENAWRQLYGRAVDRLVAGIIYYGQQSPPQIPLARADYVNLVQDETLSELIAAAVTRQQFESLDLTLTPADVDAERTALTAPFATDAAFQAAREQPGRAYPTMDDFDELIVRNRVRQTAIGEVDPDRAAAALDQIDVEVAQRFGTWDAQRRQVVAASPSS